ncbi:MAG: hypothetical protein HY556_04415 [Euryarchaeota archaeon]|nr:hypothetical protein [Euryarchaeota archaeon]
MKAMPAIAIALILTGCVADEPGGGADTAPSGPAGGVDAGNTTANESMPRLPVDLIAADTSGTLYRINATDGSASSLEFTPAIPDGSYISSIRWSGKRLYGTLAGDSPSVVSFDFGTMSMKTLAAGGLITGPLGITGLPDGRLLVADTGRLTPIAVDVENSPGWETRVLAIDVETGEVSLLASDPRFGVGVFNWLDIEADRAGNVYLVTSSTNHTAVTPSDTSDDAGAGALWKIDATNGAATLVTAGKDFRYPEALTILRNGEVAISEYAPGGLIHVVKPATGESRVAARIGVAGALWGLQEVSPGRVVVADNCSDPLNLTEKPCGPGGLWSVDLVEGNYDVLVSDARFSALSHVRTWVNGG